MQNINSFRKFERNNKPVNPEGEYVLYWMQINRRLEYNYALEYAVAWANKLNKPLLIYEGLSISYPWVCDRFHIFLMEGMKENLDLARKEGVNFFSYVEPEAEAGKGLFYKLAEKACCVISDEYPVFIVKKHNERVANRINVPFTTIDSNGIIPLSITERDPYTAYLFRIIMQKKFVEAFTHPPEKKPLRGLKNRSKVNLGEKFYQKYPSAETLFRDISDAVSALNINHNVGAVEWAKGTRKAALNQLEYFISNDLFDYAEQRNHPDAEKTSKLSPWLHFGKISAYEVVKAALEQQPGEWNVYSLAPNRGKREGFFGGHNAVQSFLDEVITWREVGFHFAHHRPDYDQFESLPEWVFQTMAEHEHDERKYIYSLKELDESDTHDEIWNAAQRQLKQEGIIHNYLRMLWGKKVIEWTPDYRTALEFLIELNNKYALDGRDPNSYSGIFWCFGRFDRAWQEREIFGKLRYMASENTRKKVKMTQYLRKYGSQKSLL